MRILAAGVVITCNKAAPVVTNATDCVIVVQLYTSLTGTDCKVINCTSLSVHTNHLVPVEPFWVTVKNLMCECMCVCACVCIYVCVCVCVCVHVPKHVHVCMSLSVTLVWVHHCMHVYTLCDNVSMHTWWIHKPVCTLFTLYIHLLVSAWHFSQQPARPAWGRTSQTLLAFSGSALSTHESRSPESQEPTAGSADVWLAASAPSQSSNTMEALTK